MPATPNYVSQRSVFLIGGYEPKSSEAFFKRTRRELSRFCETWGVAADMGAQSLSPDGLVASARVDANMRGHRVGTAIHFFVWNDIVLGDFAQPIARRVARYLVTFVDYLITGTFFRIAREAWRFSLYFLYPAWMLMVFMLLAGLLGRSIAQLDFAGAGVVGGLCFVAALYGLLKWSGRRWYVLHLMDLWSFSRDHLRGYRSDAAAHIEVFAQAIVDQAQRQVDDEIVLVGHSTGGALILEIAAAAIAKQPQLGVQGPRITVLTVGSTALKIGLHPAAIQFRKRVQLLVDSPAIQWIECQSHTDIVNFYRTNPVSAMNLTSMRPDSFPAVHCVRVRDMLQPEAYKKFKFNLFRVHYQFIMANTKRYAYDFFMMCCGERLFAEMLGDSLRYQPANVHSQHLNHVG